MTHDIPSQQRSRQPQMGHPTPAPSPFPRPVLSPYNLGALDGTPNDDRARGRQAGAFPEDLALDARNAAPPVYSALPPSAISKRRRRRAL